MTPAVSSIVCKESIKKKCFPRSAMVLRSDGTEVGIFKLQPRDSIVGFATPWHVVNDTFLADTHRGQSEDHDKGLHQFLEISHVLDRTRPLRITADHLVFALDYKQLELGPHLVRAGSLLPQSHALFARNGSGESLANGQLAPSTVLDVSKVWAAGLYNPVTTSGTAIVDGVATSNYALVTPTLQKAWSTFSTFRRRSERIGWLITLIPRVVASAGLSDEYWNCNFALELLVNILDKVLGSFLWLHGAYNQLVQDN